MVVTGVTRRIDDLGRITIPKEIRSSMRLYEGASMEFLTNGNLLCLRKQTTEEISSYGKSVGVQLSELTGFDVAVCDADKVVFAAGKKSRQLKGCKITEALFKLGEKLRYSRLDNYIVKPLQAVSEHPDLAVGAVPIVNNTGITYGIILLMETDGKGSPEIADIKAVQAAATTLGALFNE